MRKILSDTKLNYLIDKHMDTNKLNGVKRHLPGFMRQLSTGRSRKMDLRRLKSVTIIVLVACSFFLNIQYLSTQPARAPVKMEVDEESKRNLFHYDRAPIWLYEEKIEGAKIRQQNWTELQQNRHNLPLLTLFTTFKANELRHSLNNNTLQLWTWLPKSVRPVLFSTPQDDATFLDYARQLGWLVFPAPASRDGYPIVRDMFLYAINHIEPPSLFYCFANSDIVFANDLTDTLNYLADVNWHEIEGQGMLLIGKRYDVTVQELTRKALVNKIPLRKVVNKELLGNGLHLDYFISTADGYPFLKIRILLSVSRATTTGWCRRRLIGRYGR